MPSASSTCASTKCPMRALAITGIVTASMISMISSGSLMRATPPWARISAGTRSRAITATAPAASAMRACSAVTTSMITPPLSICARPTFVVQVDVSIATRSSVTSCGDICKHYCTISPKGGQRNTLAHSSGTILPFGRTKKPRTENRPESVVSGQLSVVCCNRLADGFFFSSPFQLTTDNDKERGDCRAPRRCARVVMWI